MLYRSYPIYVLVEYIGCLEITINFLRVRRQIDIKRFEASVLTFLIFLAFMVPIPSVVASANEDIHIEDPDLELVELDSGLQFPTSMAFLDENRILVVEKEGNVMEIRDNKMLDVPVLNITSNVDSRVERGLLGIAISTDKHDDDENENHDIEEADASRFVFLFYTEKIQDSDNGECVFYCGTDGIVANRLYQYKLKDNKLVEPKMILEIPGSKGNGTFIHLGGSLVMGPDNYLYLTTGDGKGCSDYQTCLGSMHGGPLGAETANIQSGQSPAGMGGILRIPTNGSEPVDSEGILGDQYPLNLYYAYGIRNSFGLDFDPVTGNLWDTENGPAFGDEVNLVEPGFNSGWTKIQGVWPVHDYTPSQEVFGYMLQHRDMYNLSASQANSSLTDIVNNLEDFSQKGKYSPPEFSWNITISPTGLVFLDSDKLGEWYRNDLFLGDFNNGNLYHFELNEDRTELALSGVLSDRIANSTKELDSVIFGQGFNGITDIEVGPDGFLYILSFADGSVYRIVPKDYL